MEALRRTSLFELHRQLGARMTTFGGFEMPVSYAAANGKVIAAFPIGTRVDAVVFDAQSGLIFASNGGGTVSVIRQKSADEYEPVGDIQTEFGAKTMTFDPKTKRLFLSTAEFETTASAEGQRVRPKAKPGTFHVLVVERQ